jgi:hypothetical protein
MLGALHPLCANQAELQMDRRTSSPTIVVHRHDSRDVVSVIPASIRGSGNPNSANVLGLEGATFREREPLFRFVPS